MFERYSEKARRTIFFARYEASRLGGSEIGTEHILLGLFREDKAIVLRYLSSIPIGDFEEIRTKIEAISTKNPKLPTSADLPLSNESKRVLAYAAEEAERLAHPRIGNKHLLLGLLREERGCAAQLLRQYGAEVATLRLEMAKSLSKDEDVVYIHGSGWDLSYVNRVAEHLRKFFWQKQRWRPADIVVRRQDGLVSFDLKLAEEPAHFELKQGHWTNDTCAICQWEFSASGAQDRTTGYSNGREWLCSECYEKFMAPQNKPEV